MRTETDSLGKVQVPEDRYWGAQTQRAIEYFSIGTDLIPIELIHAYGILKKAAALANRDLGLLSAEKCALIVRAAEEVAEGRLDDHFPAACLDDRQRHPVQHERQRGDFQPRDRAGRRRARQQEADPSQRRRQHVAVVERHLSGGDVHGRGDPDAERLVPAVAALRDGLAAKAEEWADIVKIGRTHLQDAVPLTLGQEVSGYVAMLDDNLVRIDFAAKGVCKLALGGTAVGTGINTHPDFAARPRPGSPSSPHLPFVSAPQHVRRPGRA